MWCCGCWERFPEVEDVIRTVLLATEASDCRRAVIVVGNVWRSVEWSVEKKGVRLPELMK
jgi:hypothetical protein